MKIRTSSIALFIAAATPFASAQSLAPSAADPIDSLSPSASLPIESLVPSSADTGAPLVEDSSAPSASIPIESSVPTVTIPIENLVPTGTVDVPAPTPGAATPEPTPVDESSAPSASIPIESSVPTVTIPIENLVPTDTVDVPAPTPGAATPEPTPTDESSAPSASIPIESSVPTIPTVTIPIESLVPTGTIQIESPTPTETEVYLSSPAPSTDVPAVEASCSAHAECLMLALDGDCCPTSQGVFEECCDLTSDADPLDIPDPVTLTPKNYMGCMRVEGSDDDDFLLLATCNALDVNQQFKFVGGSIQLALDTSKCLQAGRMGTPSHGNYLRVYPCDSSNDLQDFTLDEKGRLYPTDYPDVTVVFQGTTAHINEDKIIVADVTVGGVAEREEWESLN